MIPASFDYVRATSLSQAIGLLQNDPDEGVHPSNKDRVGRQGELVDLCPRSRPLFAWRPFRAVVATLVAG